ncbi:MAG: DUF6285 domain-containing protein [Alphaproteobacteria bacterium]
MRDKPDGVALLNLARAVLTEELLAELPKAARYRARMIGNAMAIAAREISDGGCIQEAERKALAALYDEAPTPAERADTEPVDEALSRLNWWLVAEIRAGRRDGDTRVHTLLRDSAIGRLRLANPKALATSKAGKDDDQ